VSTYFRGHSNLSIPSVQFIYLITLTEVSTFVKDLGLEQATVVTKPVKAHSLWTVTKDVSARIDATITKQAKKTSAMDSSYAKVSGIFGEGFSGELIETCILKQYPLRICYIDDSSVNVAVGKKVSVPSLFGRETIAHNGEPQILSKFGYKNVDVCYDGNQAVEAAEKTQYDLMLMDLQVSIHSAFPRHTCILISTHIASDAQHGRSHRTETDFRKRQQRESDGGSAHRQLRPGMTMGPVRTL
jgi:CheY-like chemotaxis protein